MGLSRQTTAAQLTPRTGRYAQVKSAGPRRTKGHRIGNLSPFECLGSARLLTFRSGQGHASHGPPAGRTDRAVGPRNAPLRDYLPATPVSANSAPGPGWLKREPAFSARHGHRGSARKRNAVPVLREASRGTAMDKITINFGSPISLANDRKKTTACLWPAKTVGAAGFEPPAPRL
jgi:hypothetical protein